MEHSAAQCREPAIRVCLWLTPTDGEPTATVLHACHAHLSPDEQRACARFVREDDRREYVVAHALLRGVLASYVNQPAESLRFETGEFGKPRLAGAPRTVEFSLAHTSGLAAVAVRLEAMVGVDVENTSRDLEVESVAGFFTPAEQRQLARLAGAAQRQAFWTMWTTKEAYLKARGLGLSTPLDSFEVELTGDGWQVPHITPAANDPERAWFVAVRRPTQLHLLTLATPKRLSDKATIEITERIVPCPQLPELLS